MANNGKKIKSLLLFFVIRFVKTILIIPRGTCRYYPSCSEYAKEAIETLPFFIAIYLIVKRILKCNPFSTPGYDPVPKHFER